MNRRNFPHHQPIYAEQQPYNPTRRVGLKNQGSTCYINAVIQQFFAIPTLRSALLRCHTPPSELQHDNDVIWELQNTFRNLQTGCKGSYNSIGLVHACKYLQMKYNILDDNDASEFYGKLIIHLEEWLNTNPSNSHTTGCLGGRVTTMKSCTRCGHSAPVENETFRTLEIPIPQTGNAQCLSLEECLHDYVKPENMQGDNRVTCDFCKKYDCTTFARFTSYHRRRIYTCLVGRYVQKLLPSILFDWLCCWTVILVKPTIFVSTNNFAEQFISSFFFVEPSILSNHPSC